MDSTQKKTGPTFEDVAGIGQEREVVDRAMLDAVPSNARTGEGSETAALPLPAVAPATRA